MTKCVTPFVLKVQEEGEKMNGNILITGANMVLPTGTKTGDLRISSGVISEISIDKHLEPLEDEMVHDASGMYFYREVLTLRFTLESPDTNSKKIWQVVPLLQQAVVSQVS